MKNYLHGIITFVLILFVQTGYTQLYHFDSDPEGYPAYCNPNITGMKMRYAKGAHGTGDGCPIGFNSKAFSMEGVWDSTMPSVVLELLPNPFVTCHVTSISADVRITDEGPIYIRYMFSTDSGATWMDPGSDFTPIISDCGGLTLNYSLDMPDFSSTQSIFIRIAGYNALDTTGRLDIRNLNVYGYLDMIDADGDGYGIYIDCDDTNPAIHPGATEICNDIDEDCDGIATEISSEITPTGVINLCRHDFVMLHAPAGYAAYQWMKNGFILTGANDSTLNTEKPGYYQVIVTDGDCMDTSDVQAVAVYDNPFANIYAPDGVDLCASDSLKLKVSYAYDDIYQWYKDGEPIPFGTYYKILATEPGTYYCHIANFYGCSRVTDSLVLTHDCRLGGQSEADFLVFPNPAQDAITVQLKNMEFNDDAAEVRVTNMNRELLYTESTTINGKSPIIQFNLSQVASGTYLLQVIIKEKVYSAPLIILK